MRCHNIFIMCKEMYRAKVHNGCTVQFVHFSLLDSCADADTVHNVPVIVL